MRCILERGKHMALRRRHLFWGDCDFTTYSLFEGAILVRFESVYALATESGVVLKKRIWQNGCLLETKFLALCGREWRWMFEATRTHVKMELSRSCSTPPHSVLRSPLKPYAPNINGLVTTLRPIEAYGSHYGGKPYCSFEPGDVGIIGAVDVPSVYHNPENPSDVFACVDFKRPTMPTPSGEPKSQMWRTSMYYHQMLPLDSYQQQPLEEEGVELPGQTRNPLQKLNKAWDLDVLRLHFNEKKGMYRAVDVLSLSRLIDLIGNDAFPEDHYQSVLQLVSKSGYCFEIVNEDGIPSA